MDRSTYDRVTDVIAPFSGLDKIDKGILDHAAARGTAVHTLINSVFDGYGTLDMDDLIEDYCYMPEQIEKEKALVQNMMDSFHLWREYKRAFCRLERAYCDELQITGECDVVYTEETGINILVDFKTPIHESKTWLLQGSAYHYLYSKNLEIHQVHFVKLDRKGKAPKIYTYQPRFDLFKSALDTYRYFYKGKTEIISADYL